MIDGFKVYKFYLALKLHFSKTDFDVFVNSNVKANRDSFEKRNDRGLFYAMGKKHTEDKTVVQYIVANMAYGNTQFIYDKELADRNYNEWVKRKQSISKVFSDDLVIIQEYLESNNFTLDSLFTFTTNAQPSIIYLYVGGRITIETFSILNELENLIPSWKADKSNDLYNVLSSELIKVDKIKKFVKYDKERINKLYASFKENLAC
jgi:hypothetical protein